MHDNIHHGSTKERKRDDDDDGSTSIRFTLKRTPHLKFMVYPLTTSVNVSVSMLCTPGVTARKSIRTDWQVNGRSGLEGILHQYKHEQGKRHRGA